MPSGRPAAVAIVAFPDTTASVVYGMYDLFASAGRDWGFMVSGEPGPELMRPVVANLTNEDLVNIAAYVASLMPTTAPGSPQR